MTFERKLYQELKKWKESSNHDAALLIEGARRVGKTTLVQEFAKKEYKDYLYIDFTYASSEIKELFNRVDPSNKQKMDDFFADLFLVLGKSIKPGGLIILDEIQKCPKAREDIKAFVMDGRFDYIETGSLISIRENVKDIQIPSEEHRLVLNPLDYEEFLWAIGKKDTANLLRDVFLNHKKISLETHKAMMNDFRLYLVLGGMPKVIDTYLKTNDFYEVDVIKNDILSLYQDDLRKHDQNHETNTLNLYEESIPSLHSWSKRIKFNTRSLTQKEKRYRSLEVLKDSRIVNAIYRTNQISFGMGAFFDDTMVKLYPLDVGLMLTKLVKEGYSMNEVYKRIRFNTLDGADLGLVYECFVAEELISKGYKLFYHTYKIEKEEIKSYEIDFVFTANGKPNAIEVKSTKRFTTSSLDNLKNKYPQIKINKFVISPKPLEYFEDKINIPPYLVFAI